MNFASIGAEFKAKNKDNVFVVVRALAFVFKSKATTPCRRGEKKTFFLKDTEPRPITT